MTVVVDQPATSTTDAATEPAAWPDRAAAGAIDTLPGLGVAAVTGIAALLAPRPWWWLWAGVCGLTLLLMAANRVVAPGVTGWSLGRAVVGIRVVRADGSTAGPGRLLARDAAHLLDTVPLLLGWLWPLWDPRRRTFADLLTGTEARRVTPAERDLQRPLAVGLAAAAALCVAVTAIGYLTVYRPDRAVERARTEIARQGPQIVVSMLSYDPATIDDDFAHAQTLITDRYRDQLSGGQDEARKAPIRHAYLVPNSAVLDAGPDQATMLVYLRGEVGVAPQAHNSTATAVVRFVRGDGRWLVDDLKIVPKSQRDGEP